MKVSEIPFDPDIGLEGLELLRSQKGELPKTGINFTVSRRSPEGGVILDAYRSQPCHGRLQNSGMFEMCATSINPGQMDGLYEYFVRDSPFGRFILNRDTFQEDGFIAVTGDLYYPFQNCLNIFARQSGEGNGPWMQGQFDDFISRGVPPLVALLVVSSTTMLKDTQWDTTNVAFRSSHSLVSCLSVDGLKNFFAGDAVSYVDDKVNRPTNKPSSFYNGVYVWEKTGTCKPQDVSWLSVCFTKNKDAIMKGRGVKKSLSPFAIESTSNFNAIRRNEFNEHALPFLLDIYYAATRIKTPSAPARSDGETLSTPGTGVTDTVQEHGNAFARAVGVRN